MIWSPALAGAQLTTGARAEGGALRSTTWWLGTALQGSGFALTFFARDQLPMLVVQSGLVGALGVTAVVQHVRRVIRLSLVDVTAVAAVMAGLTIPGDGERAGALTAHFAVSHRCPQRIARSSRDLPGSPLAGSRVWPALRHGLWSGRRRSPALGRSGLPRVFRTP